LKAPHDDVEYNELCKQLVHYTQDCKDLDHCIERLVLSAHSLRESTERCCIALNKVGLLGSGGKTTDLAHVGTSVETFEEKAYAARKELGHIIAELKAMQAHVDERHQAGVEMIPFKKKADQAEEKEKDDALVARAEADRAEEAFNTKHEASLEELKTWKNTAAERYASFLALADEVAQYFFKQ
jgi:hypothetical protein